MKLERTIDEYLLTVQELSQVVKYLKRRRFSVDGHFPNPFLEGDSILDRETEQRDVCGYVVHHPWGGSENKGLYVFRNTRLESELKKYEKLPLLPLAKK